MSGRLKQLDILRAVAVFMVMIHHAFFVLTPDYPWTLRAAVSVGRRAGWCGVDLFFVLSGFLVSGLLFKEYQKHGSVDTVRFFIRRGLKIYPSFYVFLLATAAAQPIWGVALNGTPIDPGRVVPEIAFLQNYFHGLWTHTWSLAVEEHFYLLLGLVVWALVKTRGKSKNALQAIPKGFFAVASAILLLRVVTVVTHPVIDQWRNYYPTHLRIDSLAFGVLLSYLANFRGDVFWPWVERRKKKLMVAGLALASISVAFRMGTFVMATVGYTVLYLGFGAVLLASLAWKPELGRWTKGLLNGIAFVGSHSYSIYLWHIPVALWVPTVVRYFFHIDVSWYAYVAIYVPVSLALGIGMATLIEYPALRLRDRIYPSRSQAVQVPPMELTK